jgi:acyl-CoA dehydrogenase
MNYDFTDKSSFQEYFGPAHDMVRRAAKEFVDKEIVPYVDPWEEAGEFPRELYKKAGDVGLLGIGYPEEWGGPPVRTAQVI